MAEVKPDKSDRKRVTLREVAQEAGVSLKTASNVINHSGRMADATREKVEANLRWYLYDHLGFAPGEKVGLPYRCDAFALRAG